MRLEAYCTVHSGSDIINDRANSQLIMIIPKEALAGLLTLAKQEYESDSLGHAAVARQPSVKYTAPSRRPIVLQVKETG